MTKNKDLNEKLFLSLGENCLTDDILKRHSLKSFSTPYSHGRSNIDYAISLEREKYSSLLNKDLLEYEYVGDKKVVRHKKINRSDLIFSSMHTKGFEFTHHDVISDESQIESYERKVKRLNTLRGKHNICFFYHYRQDNRNDLNLLIEKAEEFLNFYLINNCKCELIIFTQNIVNNFNDRGVNKTEHNKNIQIYTFNTMAIWGGTNDDLFWARTDDDLIKKKCFCK